jgi:transposase
MIFVGVDLGKRMHTACFLDSHGREVAKPLRLSHTRSGLRLLQLQLEQLPGPVHVIMEASGPYWLPLERRLRAAGMTVQVVNPLQTAGLRKMGIRKVKTDRKDAHMVADLGRIGRARSSYVPDDQTLELRELVRFRWHLANRLGETKMRILNVLDKVFPEFADHVNDAFGATGRELLARCASASDFAELHLDDLTEWIRSASHHQLGQARAEALQAAARDSLGLACLGAVAQIEINALLDQLQLIERQISEIDAMLELATAQLAEYLLSVPGVRGALLATVVAEVGDVERFDRLEQLIAYAGLDASVFESGDFKGTRQHISKRGSPYLRRALYLAAFKAIQVDAELAAYFQRKRAQGKPYRVAMVAVSRKLLARWYAVARSHTAYAPPQTPASH